MASPSQKPGNDASTSGERDGSGGPASQRDFFASLRPRLRWEKHPLLAWAIQLVLLAGWFRVFMWLGMQSERRFDHYWYFTILWGSIPLSHYWRLAAQDQRTRLKPSPFFFWFR